MKSVTLYTVAEHAGVSYQTVSRVVNKSHKVSPKTRMKVEAAMAKLNYIPNQLAQQLAGKQKSVIGLVTGNLAFHAPSQIVAAIKSRADLHGATTVISMIESGGYEACKLAINDLLAQRVTGLIISYALEDDDAKAIARACSSLPTLFLDVSDNCPVTSITFSNDDGARLGVEHLISNRHKKIALLAGPESSVSARLRLSGWHNHLKKRDINPLYVMRGNWTAKSGYELTTDMLNHKIFPTAILVANDQMALGTMRAITEFGLRVATDISVIGYDDTDDSSCFIPPLTTLKQDFTLIGQQAVDRMMKYFRDKMPCENQRLPVTLIERKTVLPPQNEPIILQGIADSLLRLAQQINHLRQNDEK